MTLETDDAAVAIIWSIADITRAWIEHSGMDKTPEEVAEAYRVIAKAVRDNTEYLILEEDIEEEEAA